MHNFLQANAATLTKEQLTELGIRIAGGAPTTFTASEISLSSAAPTNSNSGAAGSVTIYTGKAGTQTSPGGIATTATVPALAAAGGSRLFVFKDAELDLAAAKIVLKVADALGTDGLDISDCSIVIEQDGVATASIATYNGNGDTGIDIDGPAGTKFSGFIYTFDEGNTGDTITAKGYFTSNNALTVASVA
jgi:hypothetical protein